MRAFFLKNVQLAIASLVATLTSAAAIAQDRSIFDYEVTPDVVYGSGLVMEGGQQISRDLWMDVWQPKDGGPAPRPAIIFTHGGSWHLGNPRFTYDVGGSQTTSPADYCRRHASRGYVCFAIEYRLTQELPVPSNLGYSDDQLVPATIKFVIERVNAVRLAEGLEPLDVGDADDQQAMMNGIIAATEDLNKALDYVIANKDSYNIDAERIALQGFSAGAVTSVHVAYALNAPVAAVIANSGGPVGFDITKTVTGDSPPLLLFTGQHDLEGAIELAPEVRRIFNEAGAGFTFAWIPGAGHFYSIGSTSLGADATRMSVDERVEKFLERTVGRP